MESKRQQKFGRQIQKDLSEIFQKEFKEIFGGAMVTITDVKISPDLSLARCYLSFFVGRTTQRNHERVGIQEQSYSKCFG